MVAEDLRLAAHRIADSIFQKITGERGVFATRMAYVTKLGSRYQLVIADADGESARRADQPRVHHLAGVGPDGRELAYASFEAARPPCACRTSRPANAACWPTSKAPTARRPGHPTASNWRSASREGGTQLFLISRDGGGRRA